MKLTEQELQTFRDLSETDLGKFISDYAKRIQDYAYDSRSWGPNDSKEVAARVSSLLQELIIDKISKQHDTGKVNINYE